MNKGQATEKWVSRFGEASLFAPLDIPKMDTVLSPFAKEGHDKVSEYLLSPKRDISPKGDILPPTPVSRIASVATSAGVGPVTYIPHANPHLVLLRVLIQDHKGAGADAATYWFRDLKVGVTFEYWPVIGWTVAEDEDPVPMSLSSDWWEAIIDRSTGQVFTREWNSRADRIDTYPCCVGIERFARHVAQEAWQERRRDAEGSNK